MTRLAVFLVLALQVYAAPLRIVSTAPSITEILYALGLGDRVVGVTRFCRYPPEAQSKPKIGDYVNPDIEAIAALKPDLVVIQSNPVRLAERLAALHLKTLEVNQDRIAAIYQSIETIARAAGVEESGARLVADLRAKLDAIHARKGPKVRAMFVVGRAPGRLDGMIVAGKGSYLSELIALAGGQNVFDDAVATYPQVSLEEVLARNPDVIIDFGEMGDGNTITPQQKQAVTFLWTQSSSVKSLSAVRQHRIYPVDPGVFVVPGPRVAQAAEAVSEILRGERAP